VVSAIEDAMVVAARKYYKTEEDLRAKFNPETGQVDVFSVHMVVEEVTDPKKEISLAEAKKKNPAAEVGTEILRRTDGRAWAHCGADGEASDLQKVREAERDTIFNEYHTRVGELVTVIVKRAEGPDLIVEWGERKRGCRSASNRSWKRTTSASGLRVVIKVVDRAAKGPQVIVSRADASLGAAIVRDGSAGNLRWHGTNFVSRRGRRASARRWRWQAGTRMWIPWRVRGHEGHARAIDHSRTARRKIDIIPYSEETVAFAQKALSPAKVTRVQITDPENKKLEVIVEDSQLSLAIGKKGQNVRLASKLIGWDIDIKSEEEKRQESKSR